MKTRTFYNRNSDLNEIDQDLRVNSLAVIMGRRRIGKTELLLEWQRRGGNLAYSQAIEHAGPSQQIQQIWLDFRSAFTLELEPKSWDELLVLIAQTKQRTTFAIDEFPYLVQTDPSLPSRLQKWLDHSCPPHISLCLLGSSQSLMQNLFIDQNAALYGRARRILTIKPLAFRYFCQHMGSTKPSLSLFTLYSIVGGIPKYWHNISPTWTPELAAQELYFGPHAFFDNEILRIASDEQVSNTSAFAVLEAIGRGAHKPSDISKRLGMLQTSLTKVLQILLSSQFVKREIPFGESERNTKKSNYRIIDPFFLFHFGVYSPHRSRWSIYNLETQSKLLHDHASKVFEETYRSLFPSAARYFESPDLEIDCVRYKNENTVIVSEIKYRPLDEQEKSMLRDKLIKVFAKSRLAKTLGQLNVEFEVVDLHMGLETIYKEQRD